MIVNTWAVKICGSFENEICFKTSLRVSVTVAVLQSTSVRRVGQYVVRRCELRDLPEVGAINLASLPENYSDFFFAEILKESPETFFIAERYGRGVGYIMCRIEYGFSNVRKIGLAKKGHVVSVAILQEHRAKGLGTALIEEAIQGMKDKGCSEVYLEVRKTNRDAIPLYEKLGFKVTSVLEGYYRDGEAAYQMTLNPREMIT